MRRTIHGCCDYSTAESPLLMRWTAPVTGIEAPITDIEMCQIAVAV
jgi:hypothetical protein